MSLISSKVIGSKMTKQGTVRIIMCRINGLFSTEQNAYNLHTHTQIHAHTLTAQLESASIQVYWNSGETSDTAKLAGKVLVDAKVLNWASILVSIDSMYSLISIHCVSWWVASFNNKGMQLSPSKYLAILSAH